MSKSQDEKLKSVKLVNTMLDRRRKLTDEDKQNIKNLHKEGESIHEISRIYKNVCSRRLIQFVIYPERLKQLQETNAKNQHWKKYYNRKQLTEASRNWRHYKKSILNKKNDN